MLHLNNVKEKAKQERVKLEAAELKEVIEKVVEPFIEKLAEKYNAYVIASRQERAKFDDAPEILDLSSVKYRGTIEAVQCNLKTAGWYFKAEGDKLTVWWDTIN